MFNFSHPKLYKNKLINYLLTNNNSGDDTGFEYWNQGYSVERSQALPRTDIGLTWSRNADGTIHVEGTLEDGKTNANWRMLKPEVNNGFLCPNHKYYIHVPDLDNRFFITPNGLTRTTTVIPEGIIVHITSINNNNLNSAGFYYRYTPTQESRTVNVDLPAPYIVDLTDIYGYGNEPISGDAKFAKIKEYCELHTEFVDTSWKKGTCRWTRDCALKIDTGAREKKQGVHLCENLLKLSDGNGVITYHSDSNGWGKCDAMYFDAEGNKLNYSTYLKYAVFGNTARYDYDYSRAYIFNTLCPEASYGILCTDYYKNIKKPSDLPNIDIKLRFNTQNSASVIEVAVPFTYEEANVTGPGTYTCCDPYKLQYTDSSNYRFYSERYDADTATGQTNLALSQSVTLSPGYYGVYYTTLGGLANQSWTYWEIAPKNPYLMSKSNFELYYNTGTVIKIENNTTLDSIYRSKVHFASSSNGINGVGLSLYKICNLDGTH